MSLNGWKGRRHPSWFRGDIAETVTLDSLNLDGIFFIKLDVENREYDVLLGARETLRRCRPYVLIEIMGNYEYDCENREEHQKIHSLMTLNMATLLPSSGVGIGLCHTYRKALISCQDFRFQLFAE